MIIDLIYFLVEKHRRWKYKEDYASDTVIKTGFRNEEMYYKLADKQAYIEFYWPTIYLTSIENWDNGLEITETEKSLMFVDILFYCKENGSKAKIKIEKNHKDKDFWLNQTERHKSKIDDVELFDQEEYFQMYINDLAKAFQAGKTITIANKMIDNRADLEATLRKENQKRMGSQEYL